MPCDPEKLRMLNVLLDDFLRARQDPGYEDDDEDGDILNPLQRRFSLLRIRRLRRSTVKENSDAHID